MNMNDRYFVTALKDTNPQLAEWYWESLSAANLLRERLCDLKDPTMEDVHEMWGFPHIHQFYVNDMEAKMVVAEFALNNFTGKAAQVHFSMHPDNSPQQSMRLARTITNQVLNKWEDMEGRSYVHTLYGLTPVQNRIACAFVQRVGFKKMGVLPSGQRYRGEIADALVTIKERDNGR